MDKITLIEINEDILAQNRSDAAEIRSLLDQKYIQMINIMGSPGAGKTSVILKTVLALAGSYRVCVVEADLDSIVDAKLFTDHNIDCVQIKTGGFCHVNPAMIKKTLSYIDLKNYDLLIIENVGNLVCPAGVDFGADLNVVVLSVPEGDDKPYKYPLIFANSDVLIINKSDYIELEEYDLSKVVGRVEQLNKDIETFPLSCKTGQGLDPWLTWLQERLLHFKP